MHDSDGRPAGSASAGAAVTAAAPIAAAARISPTGGHGRSTGCAGSSIAAQLAIAACAAGPPHRNTDAHVRELDLGSHAHDAKAPTATVAAASSDPGAAAATA